MRSYPENFLHLLTSVKSKRPRTVIEHILKHGYITSQQLKDLYGYNHPPRAVRDVREHGVPIETYRLEGSDGKSIAAYRFGDVDKIDGVVLKSAGRTAISKVVKQSLIEKYGSKCFIYIEYMDESALQVDHRIPFEIGGEQNDKNTDAYMLLCPSANRAKSWTCEHCLNWATKNSIVCTRCYWAYPESYDHIAGKHQRAISIIFTGDEIKDYEKLIEISGIESAQDTIKKLIKSHLPA